MKLVARIKSQGVGVGGARKEKNPLLSPCWDSLLFNALEKKILDHFALRCSNRTVWKMPMLVDYTTPY